MKQKTVTVEIPDGKKAEWVNGVLTLVDEAPQKPKDVTERVKTFEDACEELGEKNILVAQYINCASGLETCVWTADLIAYLKLRIIVAALNEGWTPQFTEDEERWYPWFCLYTQEEIGNMVEDEKKRLWLFGGCSTSGSYCGLAFARSGIGWSVSNANISARLALKTEELAVYCGNQFIGIWADYILIRRGEDDASLNNDVESPKGGEE